MEYENHKLNLLDTPGLFDFALGMSEGIRAAGNVLIVLSGKSGLTVGAKKAYKQALAAGKSKAFFISKMDSEHADFYKVLEQLKSAFGPTVCPLVVPYVEDHKVQCYIDLLKKKAFRYDGKGNATVVDMPDLEHRYEGLIAAISEAVAETDEELFENEYISLTLGTQKNIALIAHDTKKADIIDWCQKNKDILSRHFLCGTGTTAKMIADKTGLPIRGFNSGPLGGDQQIGSRIVEGKIDLVIFFSDPLAAQPHDPDVKALLRIAQVYDIPIANNRATADFLITSEYMNTEYTHYVVNFKKKIEERAKTL